MASLLFSPTTFHELLIWLLTSAVATSGITIRRYVEHNLWLLRLTICALLGVESGLVALVAHALTGVSLDTAFIRALLFIGFAMIISLMMFKTNQQD